MSVDGLTNTDALDALKELLGDDFSVLLTDFKQQLTASLLDIELALLNNNYHLVRSQAHKLKGSALDFQCVALANICSELEKAARTADQTQLKVNYQVLCKQAQHVFVELESVF